MGGEDPSHYLTGVLDVGQGSGQWAFDLCEEFPDALVVGFDLALGKPTELEGYRFVRGNLLDAIGVFRTAVADAGISRIRS